MQLTMPLSDLHPQRRPLPLISKSPAHNGTDTSKEAAKNAKINQRRGQMVVLHAIQEAENGLTRDQLATITGLPTATICARANELIKLGEIGPQIDSKTGKKKRRPTRTGNTAEVLFYVSPTP